MNVCNLLWQIHILYVDIQYWLSTMVMLINIYTLDGSGERKKIILHIIIASNTNESETVSVTYSSRLHWHLDEKYRIRPWWQNNCDGIFAENRCHKISETDIWRHYGIIINWAVFVFKDTFCCFIPDCDDIASMWQRRKDERGEVLALRPSVTQHAGRWRCSSRRWRHWAGMRNHAAKW